MKVLKLILSFLFCCVLLTICIKYLVTEDQKIMFLQTSLTTHILSYLFCLSTFVLSGFEMKYAYMKFAKIKLTNYDVIALPLSMNFCGLVIPFQGATFYMLGYLKFKYKINIAATFNIYLFIFLLSLSIGAFAGIIFLMYNKVSSFYTYLLFGMLFLNPLLLIIANKFISALQLKNVKILRVKKLMDSVLGEVSLLFSDFYPMAVLIGFSIISNLLFALWAYWLTIKYNIDMSFVALLVMFFLLRVTLLLKITPGNLGITQLASGGLIALLGFKGSDAIFLTTFQSLSLLLVAFSLGILFFIMNFRYFTFEQLKQVFKSSKSD